MLLKDKTALITGGNRGIGAGIAHIYAQNGCNLAILCRNDNEQTQKLKQELIKNGVKVEFYKCDISDFNEVQACVKTINTDFQKIDILVNNAGITKDMLVIKMSEENFDDVININLKGAFNLIRNVSPLMWRKKYGKIINISSVSGIYGSPGQANYAASKAGIIGMTKALSKELGIKNITVNAIAPGFIETDMTSELNDDYKQKIMERLSLKRLGNVKDVADLALFLASENSGYITGQVISVDGGLAI